MIGKEDESAAILLELIEHFPRIIVWRFSWGSVPLRCWRWRSGPRGSNKAIINSFSAVLNRRCRIYLRRRHARLLRQIDRPGGDRQTCSILHDRRVSAPLFKRCPTFGM